MRIQALLPSLATLLLLACCQSGGNAKHPTQSMDNGAQPMGSLTEAEFAALHELNPVAPPPALGMMVKFAADQVPAYFSPAIGVPAGKPAPLVFVIHEWWGLNDNVRHWADRLAAEGYNAMALDLYGGKSTKTAEEAMALMRAVDAEAAKAVLVAANRYAKDVLKAPHTASIGWCFGGHWSLECALNLPDLDGAVIYYGSLVSDPAQLKAIHGKICGIFGNLDQSITPANVDAFEQGLTTAKVPHEIHRYDANHAFANPSGQRYDSAAAADAWVHARAFLSSVLKPG